MVALLALACAETEPPSALFTGDLSKGNPNNEQAAEADASGVAPDPRALTGPESQQLDAALEGSPVGCNVLDTASCLLPFPSDFNTVDDPTSPTGRRVDFPSGQLPNGEGTTFDPSAWNELDGFSPSTPILVQVPGLDPERTNLPSERDIAASLEPDSATVLVNLDSGQLVPHWAELDARADDPQRQALIIRPAVSLTETNRFAVVLRDINGIGGPPLEAPIAYKALRDNITTDADEIEEVRADYETVFEALAADGVNRADTYLTWWFTVASPESLAGNVLSMRDDAMGKLNGGAPEYSIDEVVTESDDEVTLRDGIAKIVSGTYEVPLYLDSSEPGGRMVFDSAGKPVAQGTYTARFICTIPTSAVTNGEARPVIYGHGLLGGAEEARSSHVQHTAAELNAVYCGTDAIGLADPDTIYAGRLAGDISLFPSMPDRLQQAILNYLYLGRLLVNVDGFPSSDEFATEGGAIMLNNDEAYWDGNSQGAILGGAVTAVAQDWTKAVLGVGGMNYSTLLSRSVDFDPFFDILDAAYPDPLEQQLIFGLMQMLWDRGETSGYVQHLTNRPYNLTPPHQVIMNVAFGDHQVANITADNIARTLGIPVYEPILPEGVIEGEFSERFFGLDAIEQFPYAGSALFYWYSGTLDTPVGNITTIMGDEWMQQCSEPGADEEPPCVDPHEDPRRQPEVIEQKDAFFTAEGLVTDVCNEEPCLARPRSEFDY
ncbi:MAG: hypothetical protein R2716_02900 [Microthrixaceae bacterium]